MLSIFRPNKVRRAYKQAVKANRAYTREAVLRRGSTTAHAAHLTLLSALGRVADAVKTKNAAVKKP